MSGAGGDEAGGGEGGEQSQNVRAQHGSDPGRALGTARGLRVHTRRPFSPSIATCSFTRAERGESQRGPVELKFSSALRAAQELELASCLSR